MVLVVKIVGDLLITGQSEIKDQLITEFAKRYTLGTVSYGPGVLRFYVLNIIQADYFTVTIDGVYTLKSSSLFNLSRSSRKESGAVLNKIEVASYMYFNSTIGWFGKSASPFWSFYDSYLQQKMPYPTAKDMVCMIKALTNIQKLGTTISFSSPSMTTKITPSILIFAYTGRICDHGQLFFVSDILFGELQKESMFQTLLWMSHKSNRPFNYIASADILDTSDAIGKGRSLKAALIVLLVIMIKI